MDTLHNFYGWLGYCVFFSLILRRMIDAQKFITLPFFKHHTITRFSLNSLGIILYSALALWAIFYLRGFFSDLSVITTTLLLIILVSKNTEILHGKIWPMVLTSSLGVILYLSALGLLNFDLYSYGYHSRVLFGVTLSFAAICILCRQWRIALLLLLALTASSLHINASPNLWDALIDPFLCLYCIFLLLRKVFNRVTDATQLTRIT